MLNWANCFYLKRMISQFLFFSFFAGISLFLSSFVLFDCGCPTCVVFKEVPPPSPVPESYYLLDEEGWALVRTHPPMEERLSDSPSRSDLGYGSLVKTNTSWKKVLPTSNTITSWVVRSLGGLMIVCPLLWAVIMAWQERRDVLSKRKT